MYLGKFSMYSRIKGILNKPNLNKADLKRLSGFDEPIDINLLQATGRIYSENNKCDPEEKFEVLNSFGDRFLYRKIYIKGNKAFIDIEDINSTNYVLEFNYMTEQFPLVIVKYFDHNNLIYTKNLKELNLEIYKDLNNSIREFITDILYHIYIYNYDKLVERIEI